MRISKYILLLMSFAAMAVGCVREEMAQIDPDEVIIPVLHDPGFPKAPEAITITAANQTEELVFTWDAAHLGFGAQFNYAIEVYTADSLKVEVGGGVNATTTTVTYEDINYALVFGLGATPAEPVKVNFCLSASVGVRKFYSEPWPVIIIPTNAAKQYPHVYFIGSYCDWKHDASQLLYDFAENDVKFHGLIDLGEKWESTAQNGFKITPDANWNAEWGYPYEDGEYDNPAVDPKEVALVTSGGGDIVHYRSHRFYHFTLSKETGVLTCNAAFDNISLNFGGNEMPLAFHAAAHSQVFYADVTVAGGEKFSISTDAKEGVAFGADDAATEGLLVLAEGTPVDAVANVEPGNYRLYVNLNNWDGLTYEFDAEKYGTEEGSGSVVVTVKGWGLCGYMNNWKGDLMLEYDGECWWVAYDVELKNDYDFIIRKDGSGATVFGGEFLVNKPTYLSHSGGDIIITAPTDYYDIYFNPTNGCCWFINDGSEPTSGATAPKPEDASDWTICGEFNDWGQGSVNDLWMFVEGKYLVARSVTFKAGEQFKFRELLNWNSNKTFPAVPLEAGKYYPLYSGTETEGNISIAAAGTYDVYMSKDCKYVYLMNEGDDPENAVAYLPEKPENAASWSLSGTFVGWNDWWMVEEGDFYVAKSVHLTTADRFKFRFQSDWAMSRGGAGIVEPGFWYSLTSDGGDIQVGADGTYDIYLSKELDKLYFMAEGELPASAQDGAANMSEWAVSGTFNGWSSSFMKKEGHCYVLKNVSLEAGAGFKFRKGEWEDTRTISRQIAANTGYAVAADANEGTEIKVSEAGVYDIYLTIDLTTMYLMTAGTDPREAAGVPFPDLVDVTIYADTVYDYLYGWWDGTEEYFTAPWAGNKYSAEEEIDGTVYKKWILSVSRTKFESSKARIILNGTGGQTADSEPMTLTETMFLTIKNNAPAIKGDGDDPVETPETAVIKIYIETTHTNLYSWLSETGTEIAGTWSGTPAMGEKEVDGCVYKYWELVIDASLLDGTQACFIVSSQSGQTSDSDPVTLEEEMFFTVQDGKVTVKTDVGGGETGGDTGDDSGDVGGDTGGDDSGDTGDGGNTDIPTQPKDIVIYSSGSYSNLYMWLEEDGNNLPLGPWPGTAATAVSEKINGVTYTKKWVIPADMGVAGKSVQMILNDNGKQTDDSPIIRLDEIVCISQHASENNDYIVWDNRPSDTEKTTVTIYCESSNNYLYGWFSDGTFLTDTWPGTLADGKEVVGGKTYKKWTLNVSAERVGYDKARFIISNNAGTQTNDGDAVKLSTETYLKISDNKVVQE